MVVDIDLNELIIDTFRGVATNIINCEVDRAVLKGGRSSTKSQVISECILTGCMVYKESAVAAVKYENKIGERLVNTFSESIRYLGVEDFWKLRKSPYEYVLLDENGIETDVSIKFTGCDKPDNLKSYKPRAGTVFRYIWFEELTNFPSLKEVNSLVQTFSRGAGKHTVIMSYNPPQKNSSWVNKEYNVVHGEILAYDNKASYTEFDFEVEPGHFEKIRQVIHHSSYLDVIKSGHADWLGTTFIGDAKKCEVENNKYYRWAYLGEVVGTEANVFNNIKDWDGDINQLSLTEVFRGLDHGLGGPDPTAYVEWYYDRRNKCIYALNEFSKPKMAIEDVAFEIRQRNKHNFPVNSESATPILNTQLRSKGVNILDVKKGPDSIRAGLKWLNSLNGIYINKYITPTIYKEFTEYEYLVDKDDTVTNKLPDSANHTIDSSRYAFVDEIRWT